MEHNGFARYFDFYISNLFIQYTNNNIPSFLLPVLGRLQMDRSGGPTRRSGHQREAGRRPAPARPTPLLLLPPPARRARQDARRAPRARLRRRGVPPPVPSEPAVAAGPVRPPPHPPCRRRPRRGPCPPLPGRAPALPAARRPRRRGARPPLSALRPPLRAAPATPRPRAPPSTAAPPPLPSPREHAAAPRLPRRPAGPASPGRARMRWRRNPGFPPRRLASALPIRVARRPSRGDGPRGYAPARPVPARAHLPQPSAPPLHHLATIKRPRRGPSVSSTAIAAEPEAAPLPRSQQQRDCRGGGHRLDTDLGGPLPRLSPAP